MTAEDLKFREFGLTESGRPQGLCLDDGGRQRPLLLKIEGDVPPGTPAYGYVMAMAKGFRIRQRRDTERILAAAYRRYRRAPLVELAWALQISGGRLRRLLRERPGPKWKEKMPKPGPGFPGNFP